MRVCLCISIECATTAKKIFFFIIIIPNWLSAIDRSTSLWLAHFLVRKSPLALSLSVHGNHIHWSQIWIWVHGFLSVKLGFDWLARKWDKFSEDWFFVFLLVFLSCWWMKFIGDRFDWSRTLRFRHGFGLGRLVLGFRDKNFDKISWLFKSFPFCFCADSLANILVYFNTC